MNGERIAFENWLGIKPCGAAHDLAWAAWQARASLPAHQQATPVQDAGALHLFEFWWEAHMPQATQAQAWAAWMAAQGSNGATIEAAHQATPEPVGEPLFWYRPRSDGGYEGPLHDSSIEDVRKRSGAWMPLFSRPAPGVPEAWDEGYKQGVEDERTSEANIGVAGFGAKVAPARQNPYRAAAQAKGGV